jgi:GTPase SAR1 family protein
LYFLVLIAIAYGLTDLFADSRDVGYISTRSDISPNLQELWFSLLALCFGAFYGNASVVAWFDWKKKFQSESIILSSLIVAENFFKVITPRPLFFVIGAIASAYLTHYFRNKEGEYIKYQASTVIIAVISILAVGLALFNYFFGRYDDIKLIWYFLLAFAFGAVILKFSIYEISNLKLFIVGPRSAGKTVFVSLLYEEALKQKRTIGDVPENLVEPLGMLRKGRWPSSSVGVKPYDFRYVHGKFFAKEVNIDIDYSGELFELQIDNITQYLRAKNANSSISPEGDVEKIADGIYNADKLIFIIDPERINSTDGSGDYITEYYMPILREIPGRLCYLLITKSDELYKDKQIDGNYEKFRKYVTNEIEIEEPSYKDIKGRAKAVLPVFIYVKDDQPLISNGKLSFFGFDKVLDIIGK